MTGNQSVTQRLSNTVSEILNSDSDIDNVNVSATTNGHTTGDHVYGDAIDINVINGVHVGTSGDGYNNAVSLENQAMQDPNVRYVEGPEGDFARSDPSQSFQPSAALPGMNSHVHISVFPVK